MASAKYNDFTVIGENVHTTRVLLRKGSRIIAEDGIEFIRFNSVDGSEHRLVIPDSYKSTQDYEEGRIKHVKIAVSTSMEQSGIEKEIGLDYLASLVRSQELTGASFVDVNVDEISVKLSEQKAAMSWLVDLIQNLSDLPVSIDSSNLEVIETGLKNYRNTGIKPLLNSASLERIDALDLAIRYEARVVVTAAGNKGMPSDSNERIQNASQIIEAALNKGISLDEIYIDPLVFPISVDKEFGNHCLDAIRELRNIFGSEIHITGGMSNVSFGLPGRNLVNRAFINLAREAGADSGIIDPVQLPPDKIFNVDEVSLGHKLAIDMLLGKDEYCKSYLKAWRNGEL